MKLIRLSFFAFLVGALITCAIPAYADAARGGVGSAEEAAVFSSTMPDLPLMPGLVEMEDQALMFDKAEGRIAEVTAVLESGNAADVKAYYAHSLPQFGWISVSDTVYKRDGETLAIGFEELEGSVYVKFSLAP